MLVISLVTHCCGTASNFSTRPFSPLHWILGVVSAKTCSFGGQRCCLAGQSLVSDCGDTWWPQAPDCHLHILLHWDCLQWWPALFFPLREMPPLTLTMPRSITMTKKRINQTQISLLFVPSLYTLMILYLGVLKASETPDSHPPNVCSVKLEVQLYRAVYVDSWVRCI